MSTKRPTKKPPAKAGAPEGAEEKRRRAEERKLARARFEAEHGDGQSALWDFIYEFDTLGDWKEADEWAMERLLDHVQKIADSINRYLDHECRTMDDAFKVRRPNGYRQAAARKRHLYRRKVQFYGRVLKSAGAVVDSAFFEVIGAIVGVSKTQASDWYYEVKLPPYKQIKDLPPALEKYRDQLRWKK